MLRDMCYLVISGAEQGTITSDTNTRDRDALLGDELVSAATFGKIPDTDRPAVIAANQFSLIRVDHNVIDRGLVDVVALETPGASIPDFDGAVLGAGHHPLSFAMESHAGDVAAMALEGHGWVGVGGLDVEELDIMASCCGEETLVRGDTETIDLGLRMLDGTGADAGESLPEPIFLVISLCVTRVLGIGVVVVNANSNTALTGWCGRNPLYRSIKEIRSS